MLKLVVLSCVLACACASALAPLVYGAPLVAPYNYYYNSNYRGPLSLAPGQPANILAADGRPLDTLDVNLDRASHYTAKALNNGFHYLKKRSVALAPVLATPFASRLTVSHAPLITPAVPIARYAPFAHVAPLHTPYVSYW